MYHEVDTEEEVAAVDERVDLMKRIVDLERAERAANERVKEARAKLDAIRSEAAASCEALTKALQSSGILPTTGSDATEAAS